MATVDGIAQELALEFGEEFSDLDIADQFRRWVRETYEEVVAAARWVSSNGSFTFELGVASQGLVTLSPTVSEVRTMRIVGAPTLRVTYTPVERLIARGVDLDEAGTPRAWFPYGLEDGTNALRLRFWPVPDATYSVELHALLRPKALADTDTIPLPDDLLYVLRDGVRARVRYADGALDAYQVMLEKFMSGLALANQRFTTPGRPGSMLPVKKLRAVRQAPATPEGS